MREIASAHNRKTTVSAICAVWEIEFYDGHSRVILCVTHRGGCDSVAVRVCV